MSKMDLLKPRIKILNLKICSQPKSEKVCDYMNYNQPFFYYDHYVMDSKLRYLNLKVYCVITDRLRRVVMRGNPNSCLWLLLPG